MHSICCGHVVNLFSIFFVDATFPEIELMESEHNTRDGVRHTQAVTL